MKRKSARERYFEDNLPVRQAAHNRKGYRTVYHYVGLWNAWSHEGWHLRTVKVAFLLAELASVCLYVGCALTDSPLNSVHLASGFGGLSIVPWLLELSGVLRFGWSGDYVKAQSCTEIDNSIRYGCVIRAGLIALSVLTGLVSLLAESAFTVSDGLIALGILVSGGLSVAVRLVYGCLFIDTYHNVGGKPGSRC